MILFDLHFSGALSIVGTGAEVASGNEATIECDISGVISDLQSIRWIGSDGVEISSVTTGYTLVEGTTTLNVRKTTLTIEAAVTTTDFYCVAKESEVVETQRVTLRVFGECFTESGFL